MYWRVPAPRIRCALRLSLFTALSVTSLFAQAQSSQAVDTLIQQATFAQSTADWTKAKNAWDKVLLNDRNHPDALRGLFYEKLQQGQIEAANEFLTRLSDVEPNHTFLRKCDLTAEELMRTEVLSFRLGKVSVMTI